MNHQRFIFAGWAACALVAGSRAPAALVLTNLATYNQNFESPFLASSDPGNAWGNDGGVPMTPNSGSPGWYWQNIYASLVYEGGTPFPITAVGAYSLGFGDDRAMGNLGGHGDVNDPNHPPNPHAAWGVVFQNNTSQTIQSVHVEYTGEQWTGKTPGDSLQFAYRISATEITDFEPAGGATPGGWIADGALEFSTPSNSTFHFLDGNDSANRGALAATLPAVVPPGSFVALRWYDGDNSGTDSAMGVDDLSVSFVTTAVPEASALLFGGVIAAVASGASAWRRRLRRK